MQPVPGFFFGFVLALAFGVAHHFSLTGILKVAPHDGRRGHSIAPLTFSALLVLHTAEIVLLAALNQWIAGGWSPDALAGPAPSFTDMLYLTAISFTTLGYTSLDAVEGFRLVLMFEALLGFMLLTWSATFLFSACQKSWQQE
ncbi:ion channel [Histidinibacterium aquaticum]|uniref:Metal transporter n=1 Tax=Histidinibacterium aquaticum TaxID=2613962 RepID=A0A5J5GNP8_9RHOB|nr:ion channel [Histidinibacterium aquaticum]KAA9010006.1 metal transporter [Histidinibacterium aquaticum]